MKYRLIFILNLVFIAKVFAYETPQSCPDIATIQKVPIIVKIRNDLSYTKQVFFKTEKWIFIVSPIKTQNASEAFQIAKNTINQLSGSPQPRFETNSIWGPHWYCHYNNQSGYETFAKTLNS